MSQVDPKDILKRMKADINGTSINDIKFKDARKAKKLKHSSSINNEEDFCVTDVGTDFCSYKDIGKKKRRVKEKNNLEEWGAFDFFVFTHKLYINKFGQSWGLNIGGNSLIINKIRDKFYDYFGFCCNLIMKDYIIYFFNNHIDFFIKRYGDFYFSQMEQDRIVLSFMENYNFKEKFSEYTQNKRTEKKKNIVLNKDIREAFMIGDNTLIANYGIVIALNWLIVIKNMSKKEASRLVLNACKNINNNKMINIIKNATERYSPYPSCLPFKNPQLVISKVDNNIKLNVKFENNNKMKFLCKERKG